MKYLDLAVVNETIQTTDIKGKEYAEVNQRIKAFRMLYPEGTIQTQMISNENGVCIFQARIYDNNNRLLGTGTAYEKENSSFINKTSYIENCETSAVGRALGMCGLGIDVSVASAEEVENAINNQEPTIAEALEYKLSFGKHEGKTLKEIYEEDKGYIEWILGNRNDERLHKMIFLATGMKLPEQEEQKDRINFINEILQLADEKEIDIEEVKEKFNVESINDLTTEQMIKCIKAMQKKEVE